jgi:hypothetical protein
LLICLDRTGSLTAMRFDLIVFQEHFHGFQGIGFGIYPVLLKPLIVKNGSTIRGSSPFGIPAPVSEIPE